MNSSTLGRLNFTGNKLLMWNSVFHKIHGNMPSFSSSRYSGMWNHDFHITCGKYIFHKLCGKYIFHKLCGIQLFFHKICEREYSSGIWSSISRWIHSKSGETHFNWKYPGIILDHERWIYSLLLPTRPCTALSIRKWLLGLTFGLLCPGKRLLVVATL